MASIKDLKNIVGFQITSAKLKDKNYLLWEKSMKVFLENSYFSSTCLY